MRSDNKCLFRSKKLILLAISTCLMCSGCGKNNESQNYDMLVPEVHQVISDVMETKPFYDTESTVMSTYTAPSSLETTSAFSDVNIVTSVSDDIEISIVDYDPSYEEKGKPLLLIISDIISFASDVPIEKESITEIYNADDLKSFILEKGSLWDNDLSDYTIEMNSGTFTFKHSNIQDYSYSGHTDLRYFLIESNYFDPYSFAAVDDDNSRYDPDTNTVYIPLRKNSLYSDSIEPFDQTKAKKINEKSKASYCLFMINAGDYNTNTSASNPLNIILIKEKGAAELYDYQ